MITNHIKRRTLGLVGTGLVTVMQNQLWQGAMKAAEVHNGRVVYYPTISLSSSPPFNPHTKVLFDFVDPKYVDGLLIWYAGIAEGVGLVQGKDFFARYDSLPLITVGGSLNNYPDLSIDNYQGVCEAVDHLIKVHNRRHIGMIRGPVGHPDADERYRAYVDTLQINNLPIDPNYIAESLFELKTAAETTQAVINQWLRAGRNFDAVVTGSDYMALAAVKAIKDYGLRVPDDIAVIGFDNVNDSRASIPTLTTVRQPFYELGYQATEMLLALIDGQTLPHRSRMPSQLIVRESCGCKTKSLSLTSSTIERDSELPLHTLEVPIEQVKNLANLLQHDLNLETSHQFLAALKSYLIEAGDSQFDAIAWQNTISALRNYLLSRSNGEIGLLAETLFSQARVLVTEVNQQVYVKQQIESTQQIEDLRRTSEALLASFGKQVLMDTISEQLPALGFPGVYLSLYENPAQPDRWSRLILAYQHGQRLDVPLEGVRFPTPQLMPTALRSAGQTASLVVEPLYFEEQQLGILVLEAGPTQGVIYENLRAQISGALQGSQLLQQVQNYAAQLEQRVAERTEELTLAVEQLQVEVVERRQIQETLAHERNLLRTIIDSMPDFIYAKDTESRFTLKNQADVQFMGASSPSEIIGKTDFDYYPPEVAERFHADDRRVMQLSEPMVNHEEMIVDAEGNGRWFLTTKVPLCDNQAQVIGLVGVGREVTERKQAEIALQQSEEHARQFQEKLKALHEISFELWATESIEELCRKSIELGRSVLGYDRISLLLLNDANQTQVNRFGIDAGGELGFEHDTSYSFEDDYVMSSGILKDRKSVYVNEDADLREFKEVVGHGWNIITGIWDGDTSIGWIAADNFVHQRPLIPYQVELLNLYGLTIGYLVALKRAILEIRRLNDELEQRVIERTAQFEASNKELESFAYVVSHDLKAPLRAISQLANWFGSDYAEFLDDDGQKMLDLLIKRTQHMHDLIDGILQYSRIGRGKEQKYSVDLNQLVQEVIDGLAPPPHIQVRIGSVLPTITADRTRLEQLFQNLIGNSIKFMDKAEGWVIVDCQEVEQQWLFSVSDNGPGIDPKYHGKIFEIFQTLNSHDKYEGTGIGLALVKRIVEQWGGIVRIESTLGQGSTFFFTLRQE